MVSTLWLFAYIAGTDMFQDVVEGADLRERMFAEKSRAIDESVPFAGFFHEDEVSVEISSDRGFRMF
jgi:hypothetical protein